MHSVCWIISINGTIILADIYQDISGLWLAKENKYYRSGRWLKLCRQELARTQYLKTPSCVPIYKTGAPLVCLLPSPASSPGSPGMSKLLCRIYLDNSVELLWIPCVKEMNLDVQSIACESTPEQHTPWFGWPVGEAGGSRVFLTLFILEKLKSICPQHDNIYCRHGHDPSMRTP